MVLPFQTMDYDNDRFDTLNDVLLNNLSINDLIKYDGNNFTNVAGVTITSDGRVGIGVSQPEEDLEIDGNIQLDTGGVQRGRVKFYDKLNDHDHAEVDGLGEGTNGGVLAFYTKVDGGSLTEKIRINNVGAIGLGGADYGSSGAILTGFGSSNQVAWVDPVAFKATNDANTNRTGSSGISLISDELTNVSGGNRSAFQVGTSYDTSTGYFEAPYDGLYYFHASVLWDTNAFAQSYTGVYIGLSTLSTGDQALIINQTGANEAFNANFTQNCDGVVKLDQGQQVGVFINSNVSWAITRKFCVFGGYLIQRL